MKGQKQHRAGSWLKIGKIVLGTIIGWSFWLCIIILLLRWVNPTFTAFTLQEDWGKLGKERYSLRKAWISEAEIPDHLELAVIASEDQRFREHWGLDLSAINKALEEKEREGRIRGASTITQQVAKNLFLWPAQSYFRKAVEAGLALMIELFWSKDRIMEVYLNIAEFGPGMFGVNMASEFYYDKSATELNPVESARMVTVLPNPKLIEPEPPSDYVMRRSEWVLRNMEQLSGAAYLPVSEAEKRPKADLNTFQKDSIITLDSLPSVPKLDSLQKVIPDSIRRF